MALVQPANDTGAAAPRPQLTLPARCFTDPDLYNIELQRIFRRSWQVAGNASDVAEPGTYLTCRIADQDLAVVRGRDGELRAFYNVCQHRGHRLLNGKGTLKVTITCPYHAWAYGLDGRLRGAPNAENVPGFDPDSVALASVRVEEVGNLVFVNLDADAPAFEEQFPRVREELAAFAPRLGETQFHHRSTAMLDCNWKVAIENYGECYHCRHAHPSLTAGLIDPDAYRVELHRNHHRHSSAPPASGITLYAIDEAAGDHSREFAAWLLWPNISLQVNPGGNFCVFQYLPDGVDRTISHVDWHFGPWVEPAERDRIVEEHRRDTMQEDIDLVANVQIGLNNDGYDRGVLMIDQASPQAGYSEHSVAHMQDLWRDAMGEAFTDI